MSSSCYGNEKIEAQEKRTSQGVVLAVDQVVRRSSLSAQDDAHLPKKKNKNLTLRKGKILA